MHVFNSGVGALLCDGCRRMLATGPNGERALLPYVVDDMRHFCGRCHRKAHGYPQLLRVMRALLGGISQRALAERASLKRKSISRCEMGKDVPPLDAREALAKLLGLHVVLFELLADFYADSDREMALAVLFTMATNK